MEEDEDRYNSKVFTVEAETKQSVEESKVDINQIVEACMKQMQALHPHKEQSKRLRSTRKKLRCWFCGEEGHNLKDMSSDSAESSCLLQAAG